MEKKVRYKVFYNELINQIKNGIYKNGDKLPSERKLCEIYDISRTTVREALRKLEEDGYVIRKQGDGSYVQMKPISQNLSKLYTLRNKFREEGIKHDIKIIDFKIEKPSKTIATELGTTEDIIKIERLFFAANIPYSIERTYLPINEFSFITKEMVEDFGLYATFERYNLKPTSADETIGAKKINKQDSQYLNLKEDSVVIETDRISYFRDKKIELSQNIIRSDYFVYNVHLE